MSEREQVDWEQVGKSLNAWLIVVSQQLQAAFQQIMPVAQSISDAVWEQYRAAGMPHGDSQEGLLEWIEDLGEMKRHYQAIERIKRRHEMLISARELSEQIWARRAQKESAEGK